MLVSISLAVLLVASGQLSERPDELLRRSDVGMFAPASFRARLTLTDPKAKTHSIEIWRSGDTKTLIRFLDEHDRGKFLVRLGDELWLLTPGARKPVRVSSSYRLYGGATLDEVLGMRLAEEYEVASMTGEKDSADLVALELRSKTSNKLFPTVRYVISKASSRPVRALYRLRSGRAATSVEFLEWNERGAVYARKVVVRDLLRKGARTVVMVGTLEPRTVSAGLFDLSDHTERRALPGGAPN